MLWLKIELGILLIGLFGFLLPGAGEDADGDQSCGERGKRPRRWGDSGEVGDPTFSRDDDFDAWSAHYWNDER